METVFHLCILTYRSRKYCYQKRLCGNIWCLMGLYYHLHSHCFEQEKPQYTHCWLSTKHWYHRQSRWSPYSPSQTVVWSLRWVHLRAVSRGRQNWRLWTNPKYDVPTGQQVQRVGLMSCCWLLGCRQRESYWEMNRRLPTSVECMHFQWWASQVSSQQHTWKVPSRYLTLDHWMGWKALQTLQHRLSESL